MPKTFHSQKVLPDFFKDERLMAVSPLARIFYLGLLHYARKGLVPQDDRVLQARILPSGEATANDLGFELFRAGIIDTVLVENTPYLKILYKPGRKTGSKGGK